MRHIEEEDWIRGFVEALTLALLLLGGSFLLQWRYGFGLGDEGLLWYVSQRTFAGDLPIRDWSSYDVGRYYWTTAWFYLLGGVGLFEQILANATFGAIGFCAAYVSLIHARVPLWLRLIAALTLAVMLAYPRHKVYEQALALILAALCYLALRNTRPRTWFLFGLGTGLAAVFGRNSGVYFVVAAGLVAITIKPPLRVGAWFAGGTSVGFLPVLALVGLDAGFREAFFASLQGVANQQHSLPIPWPWREAWNDPGLHALQARASSLIVVLAPLAYLAAAAHCRKATSRLSTLGAAAAIAGLPYLHHALDRADMGHIAQGVMPLLVAIVALVALQRDRGIALAGGGLALCLIWLMWLPSNPGVLYLRQPDAYLDLRIHGRNFKVSRETAALARSAKAGLNACGARDGGLLVAPHYPGLYAYLEVRAPFWELYYLHQKPEEQQRAHVRALENYRTGVALLNLDLTVDGRDELRLANTYPLLVDFVQRYYSEAGPNLYVRPEWCFAGTKIP